MINDKQNPLNRQQGAEMKAVRPKVSWLAESSVSLAVTVGCMGMIFIPAILFLSVLAVRLAMGL